MAQNSNREYWQQLINKYSERTSELQQKEQELMIRTEALQKLVSGSPQTPESPCPCPQERPGLFQCLMKSIFPDKKKPPEAAPTPAPPPAVPPPAPAPAPAPPPYIPPPAPAPAPPTFTSVPSPTPSVPSTTTSVPVAKTNGCYTYSDCTCVPPMAKLSESSSCICSVKSESSSNKSKESNHSAIQRLQENKIETNNNNYNNRNNFMNYNFNKNTDSMSLKSEDLLMIQKLEGLVVEHKRLNKQVTELEQKERVYKECLGNGSQINGGFGLQPVCNCRCGNNASTADSGDKDSNSNKQEVCELKLENLLLKNELRDLKVEIHQHLEKIEGPMQFKVETERYKCLKLEEQLEQQKKEFYEQQLMYQKEISSLNMQLMTANGNVYELSKTNEELLAMKQSFEFRIKQLEDDLIRQKLSDFETIKSLNDALENCQQGTIPEKKESCNLNEIARQLSKTLKELGPCGECSRLPSDIKVTAEYIKELAMLIESKLPKPLPAPPSPTPPSEEIQEIVETPSPPPPLESIDEAEETPTTPEEVVVEETTISEGSTPAAEQTGGEDDDIVVVMPKTEMQSQSSKSITETADDIKLPTPPSHSPIIIDEATTKKKCQCSKNKPAAPPPPPDDRQQSAKRKCQCSRKRGEQPPTIKEEETVKVEEVVEEPAQPEEVEEKTETPPPEDAEQAEQPPTAVKKPCRCAAMKQLMGQLAGEQPVTEEPAGEESAAEESAGEEPAAEEPAGEEPTEEQPDDRLVKADRQTEILDEPPGNVHVVTVLTRSGMLDVLTRGPEGRVQTTLRYNPSGNIEVITEIMSNHNNLQPRITPNIESVHEELNNDNEELVQQEIIETEETTEEVQEGEENNEAQ